MPRECPGREMTASGEWTPPRGAEAAVEFGLQVGSRTPRAGKPRTKHGSVPVSAIPSQDPRATLGRGHSPERSPEAAAPGLPGLDSAPPPRSPPGRLGLLPACPASAPPPPPLTSARRRGGGHGSAGFGAARGRRPSALPLLRGSGLRRDAGGTNGLHYPRGPAIVRRHQAATVVLRAGGLPSLAPPSARFLPASARPPPRGPAPAARARPSPPRRRRYRRPRPGACLRARPPPAA